MDLTPYVDKLREELAVAADAGGADARALSERLTAPLESAVRLLLLEALSAAADEITRDLAPGSVEVRLRGLDPGFVVTPAPGGQRWDEEPVATAGPTLSPASGPTLSPASGPVEDLVVAGADKGETVRINLRLPEDLKARIEEAAGRERVSVNTWLVRAAASALGADGGGAARADARRGSDEGHRYTGWVR
jgi:hypothetical protein